MKGCGGPRVQDTQEEQTRGGGLRVGKYWVMSQSEKRVLQILPPFVWRPEKAPKEDISPRP